jgi:hypothetical protein
MATAAREAQRPAAQNWQRLSWLATLALASLVRLNASSWLVPLVSEYSLLGDYIGELALGRFGIVQTPALLVVGLGTVALAIAIRELTRGNTGSLAGSLLLAIYGASAILAAIFPSDRIDAASAVWTQSSSGTIHLVATLAGFLCGVAGMSLLTHWTFRQAHIGRFGKRRGGGRCHAGSCHFRPSHWRCSSFSPKDPSPDSCSARLSA